MKKTAPIKHIGTHVQITAAVPRLVYLALDAEATRADCSKTSIIIRAVERELERLARESDNGARSQAS